MPGNRLPTAPAAVTHAVAGPANTTPLPTVQVGEPDALRETGRSAGLGVGR